MTILNLAHDGGGGALSCPQPYRALMVNAGSLRTHACMAIGSWAVVVVVVDAPCAGIRCCD
eukprot:1161462-Pelagomonas_calceolata.AAC.1